MLELTNLSAGYGGKPVLKNISFRLRPGRITALVGRNGSGKSTLLSCVNQRLPYTGRILLDGQDLAGLSPRERARRLSILPQSLPSPHITGREMTGFGRNPYLDFTGRLTPGDLRAVEEALADAGAEDLAQRYVDTLSGGEKQRIALAMLLAQNTPVALLDEPASHMDPGHQAAFLEQLNRLKIRRGKTFLVILHDLNAAVRYADDLLVLEEGELRFAGSREQCLESDILEKVFGLRRFTLEDQGETRFFFAAD